MAGYSARQSSFTTGDTITAAHSNDEFNQVLAAFHATTGHTHDGTAGEGGPISTLRDSDALNKILVDTTNNHLEFYVEVSSAAVQQVRIQDGAIVPITDNDIDLGTSSLEFKDLYVDGTAYVDAINYNGTAISATAAELNILDGVTSTATELNIIDGDTTATSTTVADADRVVLNDGGTMKQVAVTDLAAYFDDEITAMPNVTSVGTLTTLTVDNIIINGTNIGHTSDTDALAIDSSGNVTASQNLVVTGDLTVSGDDITMGTNTAGNLLIADGTNFNSVAVGSLSEISTVANDDVFLAVDTSGGGLKKIARSAVVAGLATSGAISNVVEDTTPQLGGDLDVNSNGLVSTSNGNIALTPNGTGVVRIDGNVDIQTGLIDLKNGGTVSKIKFYCESSNAHAQTLQSAPHSAASSAVLVLPTASGTLIGTGDTGTLPLASIDIDGGTDIGAAIVDADLFIVDDGAGGTNRKTTASRMKTYFTAGVSSSADDLTAGDAAVNLTTSSGDITIDAAANDSDIIFKGSDNSSDITMLTLDGSDAGTAIFNNNITIPNDSGQIKLGASGDLEIYHDGSHSHIRDAGTGDLRIRTTKLQLLNASSHEYLVATSGGSVDIYHNDVKKFETTSAGVTVTGNILISDAGNIGSASDTDAIAIASNGVVTFSQTPVLSGASISAGTTPLTALDIDGGTDIGEDLVDADLFIVDNGAGGTNRKVAASRIKTYIGGGTQWQSVKTSNYTASAGQGVFANTTSGSFTVTLPSGTLGDEVTIVDYAGTFDSNALTVAADGSEKIFGSTDDLTVSTERAAFTLVFTDSTQGWLFKND